MSDFKCLVEPQKYLKYYSNAHMNKLEREFLVDRHIFEYERGEGRFSFKKKKETALLIYLVFALFFGKAEIMRSCCV